MQKNEILFTEIANKIKESAGEEGLRAFVESKGQEIPAVKLTSQQMETLKGGTFILWITRLLFRRDDSTIDRLDPRSPAVERSESGM